MSGGAKRTPHGAGSFLQSRPSSFQRQLRQAGRRRRDAPDKLEDITARIQDLVMLGRSRLSLTFSLFLF